MITTPTDRLHKLTAIGGLLLASCAGGAALQQYHETALQRVAAYEKVTRGVNAYNRFAAEARSQMQKMEKLKDPGLPVSERKRLQEESGTFQKRIEPLDRDAEEAVVQMQKQVALTEHYYRMQTIWLGIAAVAIFLGLFLSWKGFRAWFALPASER